MPEPTKAYIHKDVLKEIKRRGEKIRRYQTDLFRLLVTVPINVLQDLADQYLVSKRRPPVK